MRIVFAGTPDVAVPTLRALIASDHQVVGVITRPPARQGRSSRLVDSPVATLAKEFGLPLLESSKPSSEHDLRWISELAADIGVVVAYGALLTSPVLDSTRFGWMNLHFSTLPDLRGAAPVQRAILRGDTQIGTTVFLLDPGMDSGPVVSSLIHPISADSTSGEALIQLADAGAQQVMDSLTLIETPEFSPTPQDTGLDNCRVTLAPKLNKDDGFISFEAGATETVNRVRAVTPAPGAWTTDSHMRPMKLRGVKLADEDGLASGEAQIRDQQLFVGTSGGGVLVGEVAPAGKSWMRAADWARGARMEESDRLGRKEAQ